MKLGDLLDALRGAGNRIPDVESEDAIGLYRLDDDGNVRAIVSVKIDDDGDVVFDGDDS